MRTRCRFTAWALLIFALLFMLASAFFPAFACHHNCTGDGCPVCLQIRAWATVLRLFGAGIACQILILAWQKITAFLLHSLAAPAALRTPIALKTKLLN